MPVSERTTAMKRTCRMSFSKHKKLKI